MFNVKLLFLVELFVLDELYKLSSIDFYFIRQIFSYSNKKYLIN